MRRWVPIPLAMALVMAFFAIGPASETARTFMDGTEAYRNGDWPAAISAFKSLADGGVNNGRLFYNLGNAYLKNDDLGHALLWYERALKRIPDDPDLRFNYDYALTLTKDERGEQESPLLHILFFWKYQLSHSTVRWTAILINAALWIALSVLACRKKRLLRPSIILMPPPR
jgi:tetratricopeptide (TPR) repeat protein